MGEPRPVVCDFGRNCFPELLDQVRFLHDLCLHLLAHRQLLGELCLNVAHQLVFGERHRYCVRTMCTIRHLSLFQLEMLLVQFFHLEQQLLLLPSLFAERRPEFPNLLILSHHCLVDAFEQIHCGSDVGVQIIELPVPFNELLLRTIARFGCVLEKPRQLGTFAGQLFSVGLRIVRALFLFFDFRLEGSDLQRSSLAVLQSGVQF
mmetsp:Transcript_111890/g.316153  ORF Transcript_111890/g.316153 Transcript_111890/m.316153 type:complete len:205 (-) Transcript_111890:220-834(-)